MLWLLIGCVGANYRVPREELARLAAQDPAARGDAVRAVQDLDFAPTPPRTEPAWDVEPPGDVVVFVPRPWGFFVDVGVQVPLGPLPPRPPPPPIPPPPLVPLDPDAAQGVGGALGEIDDARALAVLAVGAAAGVLVVAAVTEGTRHDGWIALDPRQPVHLRVDGDWTTVPLDRLVPADLAGADYAVVRPDEAAGVQELARAPLDREGLTYRVELGAGVLPDPVAPGAVGPDAHLLFGGYPNRWLGVLGGVQLGWDAPGDRERFVSRAIAEVQLVPIQAGRFHLGAQAGGGWGAARAAGVGAPYAAEGVVLTAGMLGELELVTRLGLTARVGWAWEPAGGLVTPHGTIGLAVY